jgi:hypothetical protein
MEKNVALVKPGSQGGRKLEAASSRPHAVTAEYKQIRFCSETILVGIELPVSCIDTEKWVIREVPESRIRTETPSELHEKTLLKRCSSQNASSIQRKDVGALCGIGFLSQWRISQLMTKVQEP